MSHQPSKPPVQWSVMFGGKIVGMPDVWGNRFPVSKTSVELFTSHGPFIWRQWSDSGGKGTPPSKWPVEWADSESDGTFSIDSVLHPGVPNNTLFLEFTNKATGAKYNPRVSFGIMLPESEPRRRIKHFELGIMQTPWSALPPVISSWKGKQFKYPADFAFRLATSLGVKGSFELKRLLPDVNGDIDRLFSILEKESKNSNDRITKIIANEIVPVLGINLMKVRSSSDVFRTALEHCSKTRFNTLDVHDFNHRQLESAVQKAFGGPYPSFRGFEGRAAFCGLLFAAAALDAGSKVNATFGTVGVDHVTTVVIS